MRRSQKTLNTESVVNNLYHTLVNDLATDAWTGIYAAKLQRNPRLALDLPVTCPPYIFKRIYQLRDFYKRFILSSDRPYKDLEAEGFEAFIESQNNFALPSYGTRTELLVRRTRAIVTDILGPFRLSVFCKLCAPGKRAAVGLTRRKAYLDKRFTVLSGSKLQRQWFDVVRLHDIRLMRLTRHARRSIYTSPPCEHLKVTAVPKSFKSIRTIAPDTILGGFLSRGVGNYVRARLEASTHIDLAKQQDRHRAWAKKASVDGKLSTLDMSKASDSFVWDHITTLIPDDWLPVLKAVNIDKAIVGNREIELKSYMLMGSGHTFPLQTLLFYAICEACRQLCKANGRVSVYGDDIMLPTRVAPIAISCLQDLGFSINKDKSFYDGLDPEWPSRKLFRESCGGDYYGGIDVRPFMPQGSGETLKGAEACAWLHKTYNGLMQRWDYNEVPTSATLLLTYLDKFSKQIALVPDNEGMEAGIHISAFPPYLSEVLCPSTPYLCCETQRWKYWKVSAQRGRRKPFDEGMYLWYNLWGKQNPQCTTKFWVSNSQDFDDSSHLDKRGREVSRGGQTRYRWSLSN